MMDKSICIVGGGPSLRGFDFGLFEGLNTIVTNKSIYSVDHPNYFITVDYSFLIKIRHQLPVFRQSKATKIFVANFAFPYIKEVDGVIRDTRSNLLYNLEDFDLVVKARRGGDEGIGQNFADFRTGLNSGFCAFQFSVLMRYTKIFLFGIDLTVSNKSTHYHNGYGESTTSFSKKLSQYLDFWRGGILELQKVAPHIQVFSCSPTSSLNNIIPQATIGEIR